MKIKLNEELGQTLVDNETLRDLIEDSLFLRALESGGVDNWGYYEEAQQEFDDLMKEYFNDVN